MYIYIYTIAYNYMFKDGSLHLPFCGGLSVSMLSFMRFGGLSQWVGKSSLTQGPSWISDIFGEPPCMIRSDDPDQSLPLLLEQVTASLTGKSKQPLLLLPGGKWSRESC